MKNTLTALFLSPILAACLFVNSGIVLAIGDSGGRSCRVSDWILSAVNGTPAELDSNIDKIARVGIDSEFEQRKKRQQSSVLLRLLGKEGPDKTLQIKGSIESQRLWLINRNYSCGLKDFTLLDMAAAAGNMENVDYLLEHGANPNATLNEGDGGFIPKGETIFMRCADWDKKLGVNQLEYSFSEDSRSPDQIAAKLSAYALILKHGGNVNARTEDGDTALHLCNDPASIDFFLKSGASFQKNNRGFTPLDYQIKRLFEYSSEQQEKRTLDIIKLISEHSGKHEVNHKDVVWKLCIECGREGKHFGDMCKLLSTSLDSMDDSFFTRMESPNKRPDERFKRCRALTEPNCKDCN